MCRYTGMPVYRPVFGNTGKYRFRRYLGCITGIETGIENRPIFIPRLLPPWSIEHGRTGPRLSNFKRESAEVNEAAATANRNRVPRFLPTLQTPARAPHNNTIAGTARDHPAIIPHTA